MDEDIDDGLASDDLFTSDSELGLGPKPHSSRQQSSKGKAKAFLDGADEGVFAMSKMRGRKVGAASNLGHSESSSGESFDLDVSSSSSDDLLVAMLKPRRGKGKGKRAPKEGMTAIDSNSLLQATGTAGVEESTPSIPTTRRRRRRPKSSISSDAESDLYLPDPVTPKAPKAKASRRSDEGLEHTLPTTVAESLALETDTVQTLTPKPKRRASGPKNTIVLAEALGSSRPYSTGTKTVGGATAPALMTPRTFPLLGAHLTLSKTHPTSLLLPVSDSDSDDVVGYDFSKLGAGVAHMRVTKQVVDGRMREMWELSSSESRSTLR